MLEPDALDITTWNGHADRIPAHPILSTSSLNHGLEQSALGEHHGSYTHRHAQLVDLCQGDKHAHEAVQPTPSFTSDLNPNASSTTPSISVHRSVAQPALPQQRETVIMQDIPSYNHSKSPSKTSSENVNAHANTPENHPRNIIEPSKHHSSINDELEVIDLTLSDEDHDKQAIQTTKTTSRSSINCVESLFTPPPPKRRRRTLMDYVAVPPLQKGLTKADYSPMSASTAVPIATGGVQYGSVCDALGAAFNQNTARMSLPAKGKEKEREHVPAPSSSSKPVSVKKSKKGPPSFGSDVDTTGNTLIDAVYTQIALPLEDPDVLPPIFRRTVVTNTRFAFAWSWGKLRKGLRPDEVGRVMKYHLCPDDGNCASLQDGVSIGFTSMETGRVLLQECPSWELVPPSDSPKKADDSRQRTENVSDPTLHGTSALNSRSSSPTLGAGRPDIPLPPEAFRMDADVPMDQYLNCFGDSPGKQLSPSREDHTSVSAFQHQTPQLAGPSGLDSHAADPFIDPALVVQSVERDGFLGVPPSPDVGEAGHQPDSTPISPFLMDGRNENGDALPGLYDDKPPSPWAEVGFEQATTSSGTSCPGDNAPSFESGTIDPSLLGGEQALKAPPTGRKNKPRHALPEPIIYVRRPQDALSLPWMRGNRSVQIKFRQQECPTVSDGQDEESAVVPPSPPQNNKVSDDPDWVPAHAGTSEHRSASTSKLKLRVSRTSITRVESDTDSSFVPTVAGPTTAARSKEKPLKGPRKSTKGAADKMNDVPDKMEKTFCHHCRNTTGRLKMQCSNDIDNGRTCGKRFCQRCIQRRYPDITFDQFSRSFLCPYCTNTCNCSQCARKRGEEFISMRTGAFVGPRVQSELTFMRNSVPAPPIDSTETAASTSEAPQNFWAHVYGLEGERLGGAYWNQAASGTANRKAPRKPPRVFIGHPQEYWKVRSSRYLEPMSDSVSAFVESLRNQGKGKGKAVDRPLRLFVGNPAALHEPFERMPPTPSPPSSRFSSPGVDADNGLSPLQSYWPQPDVGEWCSWEPPPPVGAVCGVPKDGRGVSLALSDEQVARAIHVALAALS